MKRLLIALMVMLATVTTASAAMPQRYDITTIAPGQPWQLLIKMGTATNVLLETQGKTFLAIIGTGKTPPLEDKLLARFYVDISTVQQGAILIRLTAAQTTALAGKRGVWTLIYIPDTGGAQAVATGNVEVKP